MGVSREMINVRWRQVRRRGRRAAESGAPPVDRVCQQCLAASLRRCGEHKQY